MQFFNLPLPCCCEVTRHRKRKAGKEIQSLIWLFFADSKDSTVDQQELSANIP